MHAVIESHDKLRMRPGNCAQTDIIDNTRGFQSELPHQLMYINDRKNVRNSDSFRLAILQNTVKQL